MKFLNRHFDHTIHCKKLCNIGFHLKRLPSTLRTIVNFYYIRKQFCYFILTSSCGNAYHHSKKKSWMNFCFPTKRIKKITLGGEKKKKNLFFFLIKKKRSINFKNSPFGGGMLITWSERSDVNKFSKKKWTIRFWLARAGKPTRLRLNKKPHLSRTFKLN